MALPSPTIIPKARAVNQSFETTWAPYGAWADKLLIHVYSDFQAMFNAFGSGQIDVTDWECNPNNCLNTADTFVTTPEGELAIYQLNINQHGTFLTIPQQDVRAQAAAANVKGISIAPTTACGVGFARLVVNLKNEETFKVTGAKPLILDPANTVTASSTSGTFTVSDSGGGVPNGQYVLPSAAGCIPQNAAYTLSTGVYGGSVATPIAQSVNGILGNCNPVAPNQGCLYTLELNVHWNSASLKTPSAAGVQINRALSHLVDRTRFVNDASLAGQAANLAFWSPPAQGYNNVCDSPVGGASALSQICQVDLNADCTPTADNALGINHFAVNVHPWVVNCAPIAPYDLNPGPGGPSNYWWANQANAGVTDGYPSVDNLHAACDHFVAAGLPLVSPTAVVQAVGDATHCIDVAAALTGNVAPVGPGYWHISNQGSQIIVYPRTHPPRKHFGTIYADGINALFGTPNNGASGPQPGGTCTVNYGFNSPAPGCTAKYYTITQIFDIVFSTNLGAGADDWKLYTGGNTLGSLGDDTYFEYNSAFSASICAGPLTTYSNDYTMICDPALDTWTHAGEFSSSLTSAGLMFRRGFLDTYAQAMVVSNHALIRNFMEKQAWNFQPSTEASLVQVLGAGTQVGFQSLLNMHCNTSFVPNAAAFGCGTGGTTTSDPSTIFRGFSQDVHKLSWYTFQSLWDAEVLIQIYDSMLGFNPRTGGASLQVWDFQTTDHSAVFDPNEISCTAPSQGVICASGTTTQTWHLRNGLKFQDNFPLTPDDVCFTIQSFRDVPSSNLLPNVAAVTEDNPAATVHQSGCKVTGLTTLQVKLQGQSPFFESEIGGLPIVPKHLWAAKCGTFPFPQPNPCADPTFDAMATGIVVGDGPWQCNNIITGAIGGSCTQNAGGSIGTQDVVLDGRIALNRYQGYHACCPNADPTTQLQSDSWSDANDDCLVNILDVASAALQFGKDDPYWDHPLYGTVDGKVDIGEISTLALNFGHKVGPAACKASPRIDPTIDTFNILNAAGSVIGYFQGATKAGGVTTIYISDLGIGCTNVQATVTGPGGPFGPTPFALEAGSVIDCQVSFGLANNPYHVHLTLPAGDVFHGDPMAFTVPAALPPPPGPGS